MNVHPQVTPTTAVLQAFGCDPHPVHRLEGGQGTTWRAGDVVLKPCTDAEADTWIAETTAALQPTSYRVAQPIRADSGSWTAGGWCAWQVVSGEHGSGGRWPEIAAVSRSLTADLASFSRPSFLDRRNDPWALADAVAWGRSYEPRHDALRRLLARCADLRRPDQRADQVIHGDLCGNVLFTVDDLPAVIDLSPFWRPAAYALAVAAVDALAWYDADDSALDDLADLDDLGSLLARAAIFRLVTSDIMATAERLEQQPEYVEQTVAEFRPVIDLIERVART